MEELFEVRKYISVHAPVNGYLTSNSYYGKMDKGEIWRLIGRTCHLQQDRQKCLSYRQFC